MTTAAPLRRALADLSVNTTSTPNGALRSGKMQIGQKRPHWAMESSEEETPEAKNRRQARKWLAQLKTTQRKPSNPLPTPTYSPISNPDTSADMSVQNGSASPASTFCFDIDDSMTSQYTAATSVPETTRLPISQQAEHMRLRLQLAAFKLRTNQIDVPFSQLKARGAGSDRSQTLRGGSSPSSESSSPTIRSQQGQKNMEPSSPQALDQEPESSDGERHAERRGWNTSRQPSQEREKFRTPALPRRGVDTTEQESPSRPGGGVDALTSSAIKGDAARSLLGLRGQH